MMHQIHREKLKEGGEEGDQVWNNYTKYIDNLLCNKKSLCLYVRYRVFRRTFFHLVDILKPPVGWGKE